MSQRLYDEKQRKTKNRCLLSLLISHISSPLPCPLVLFAMGASVGRRLVLLVSSVDFAVGQCGPEMVFMTTMAYRQDREKDYDARLGGAGKMVVPWAIVGTKYGRSLRSIWH